MYDEPYPTQVPPFLQGAEEQTSTWHWKTFLPRARPESTAAEKPTGTTVPPEEEERRLYSKLIEVGFSY